MRSTLLYSLAALTLALQTITCHGLSTKTVAAESTRKVSFERAVEKARSKLERFAQQEQATVLIVDGNNVRGIAKFEWSPMEVICRVQRLCEKMDISNHIIVWDHGPMPFIAAHGDGSICIFSGLSQRADDVMVHEALHIVECTGSELSPQSFLNLCFITNDGGLQSRLNRLGADPTTRRSTTATARTNPNAPKIVDSTRFVELLKEVDYDLSSASVTTSSSLQHAVNESIQQAQQQLQQFAHHTKARYNPRREKTWERCVLAEAMVFGYTATLPVPLDRNCFTSTYVQRVQNKRTFKTPDESEKKSTSNAAQLVTSNREVVGPMRLDRRQKRQLTRYNRALQKGTLTVNE